MNIVTGEKIQLQCNFFIGEPNDFAFNPTIRNVHSKHISIFTEKFPVMYQPISIFCYTHILAKHFDKLYQLLSTVSHRFTLYFHNSDDCFSQTHTKLLEIPLLDKIYTQNIAIQPTDRIIPLPIGIANQMWKHGDLNVWKRVLESPIVSKTNHIYCFFKIETNKAKRSLCYNAVVKHNIPIQPALPYEEYLRLLQTFKYAICPEGNGLDTHRFWECVYLKVIPICLRNHITEYYSKQYPVMLIDNWDEIEKQLFSK